MKTYLITAAIAAGVMAIMVYADSRWNFLPKYRPQG